MRKYNLTEILVIACYITLFLVVIGVVGMVVYCFIAYGGKPISEVPAWALWFMFGGGR